MRDGRATHGCAAVDVGGDLGVGVIVVGGATFPHDDVLDSAEFLPMDATLSRPRFSSSSWVRLPHLSAGPRSGRPLVATVAGETLVAGGIIHGSSFQKVEVLEGSGGRGGIRRWRVSLYIVQGVRNRWVSRLSKNESHIFQSGFRGKSRETPLY